ncbi:MAG: FkbM family methyltransferase [Actinomycetota bacterium]
MRSSGFLQCRDFLDGGAGSGDTARKMLEFGLPSSRCYAFEPFVGNLPFFEDRDERVVLFEQALGKVNSSGVLFVSSIVEQGDTWAARGLQGYSSVGRLVASDRQERSEKHFDVEVVRADDVIPEDANVDFVKLDLQGGESAAIEGMPRIMSQAVLCWVEYAGDPLVLELLRGHGFALYDTPYLFQGAATPLVEQHFGPITSTFELSNGVTAFHAFRRTPWKDHEAEFTELRSRHGLIQTDLVACRPSHVSLLERLYP